MTFAARALALIAFVATSTDATAQGTSPGLDSLFTRREVKIAMRDGVKLFTVILTPRSSTGALPIILSRTPYGTADWGGTLGIKYGFQELIREGVYGVTRYEPTMDKIMRLNSVTSTIENGFVHLPDKAAWLARRCGW